MSGAPHTRAVWDPAQYERFKAERAQPFYDLLARLPVESPVRTVADLGCGTGELTRRLAERWPEAEVIGVDSSHEMLKKAALHAIPGRLSFAHADLTSWSPARPLDLIFSNAALHWVKRHDEVIPALAEKIGPGGALAVQVPNNHAEPGYQALNELLHEAPWKHVYSAEDLSPSVEPAQYYAEILADLGLEPTVWETIYYHRLPGPEAIVEWVKGSTLRPLFTVLTEDQARTFLEELSLRMADLYRPGPHGVLFPFRRIFFIGKRS